MEHHINKIISSTH